MDGYMTHFVTIFLWATGAVWLLGFGAFSLVFHFEGEPRPKRIALAVALGGAVVFFLAAALPMPVRWVTFGIVIIAGLLGIILFFLPIGRVEISNDIPSKRFDERDIMFARNNLEPGSPQYEIYYQMRPENEANDNRFRKLPGLLSSQSKFANPFHFASTAGSFDLTEALPR
jgi:hypothetical protein